jgi:hypothetical protein
VPTSHPRKMITINPRRAALLDEVAALEGSRPDLGSLIDEGARARLERLRHASPSTLAARRRLADRVRSASLDQDADAADRVKRLGLEP